MNATYGYTPKSPEDKWLKAAQEELRHASQAGQPAGVYLTFDSLLISSLTNVIL